MVLSILFLFLPSRLKIYFLKQSGASIGKNCYIGFSLIQAQNLILGDDVYIGHLNLIWRLKDLCLESGSRIGFLNWIAGANEGGVFLRRNSAITRLHYFDSCSNIELGENSIVAGLGSIFFTHGLSSNNRDQREGISIGKWCYIGASSRFVPGSGLADGTFVGMGAVVTKRMQEEYVLLIGVPAQVKKKISSDDAYFDREYLHHDHHTKDYRG